MIPRFAAHLRIDPGPDPVAAATDVFARVEEWLEDEIDRGPLSLPLAGGTVEPAPGSRIGLRLDPDRGGWRLVYRREQGGGAVETKLRLRVGEAGLDFALLEVADREPIWRLVGSPAILGDLLESRDCHAGAVDVPAGPTVLPAPAVEDFVEDLLLAPDRSLPLVAISQDDYLGRPLVDPEAIAARLAGLARVFVLEDKSASFALTRSLGNKELSCYMGAVRLYLPGFSLETNPYDHLLLLANRLRGSAGRGGSAADLLLSETMARFPAWLTPSGPLADLLAETSLRQARQGAPREPPRDAPREAPAREPEASNVIPLRPATVVRPRVVRAEPPAVEPPPTVIGLLPRVRELVEENKVLFARNDELERAIEDAIADRDLHAEEADGLEARLAAAVERELDLETRLAEAERENADLRFALERVRREHPELLADEPKTVLEAVRRVAAIEDPSLLFLPAAFISAEDSPYRDPPKVLSALQALADVAALRRRSAEAGSGMGGWPVHLFESRGIRYAAHNSTTSKGRWYTDYHVLYDGKRVALDEHLSLGSSHDPAACLRIYFFWDPDRRVTVVAHVGRHKRNTLS